MNWGATDRSGWDSIFGPLMSDLRNRVIREQSFRSSLGPFEVYNIVHRLLLLLVFFIMSIVLVRGTHSYISSGESSDWLIYLQVTVPLVLLARTSSANFCEKVILLGGSHMFPSPIA